MSCGCVNTPVTSCPSINTSQIGTLDYVAGLRHDPSCPGYELAADLICRTIGASTVRAASAGAIGTDKVYVVTPTGCVLAAMPAGIADVKLASGALVGTTLNLTQTDASVVPVNLSGLLCASLTAISGAVGIANAGTQLLGKDCLVYTVPTVCAQFAAILTAAVPATPGVTVLMGKDCLPYTIAAGLDCEAVQDCVAPMFSPAFTYNDALGTVVASPSTDADNNFALGTDGKFYSNYNFRVTTGTTAVPPAGGIVVQKGDALHFWSATGIAFNVTLGSAVVKVDITKSADAGNALVFGTDGKLFVPAAVAAASVCTQLAAIVTPTVTATPGTTALIGKDCVPYTIPTLCAQLAAIAVAPVSVVAGVTQLIGKDCNLYTIPVSAGETANTKTDTTTATVTLTTAANRNIQVDVLPAGLISATAGNSLVINAGGLFVPGTSAITNVLSNPVNGITSTVSGVASTLTPVTGVIQDNLGFSAAGVLVKQAPAAVSTTNVLSNPVNAITSTVNGVASTLTPALGTPVTFLGFDATGALIKTATPVVLDPSINNGLTSSAAGLLAAEWWVNRTNNAGLVATDNSTAITTLNGTIFGFDLFIGAMAMVSVGGIETFFKRTSAGWLFAF